MNKSTLVPIQEDEEVSLYVLKLRDNKYYVGITRLGNLYKRLYSHFNMEGSMWTKQHRPVDVVETIERCDKVLERLKTLEYMIRFGYENVRGGAWHYRVLSGMPIPLQVFESGVLPAMTNGR